MGTGPITVNYLPDGDDWAITVTTGDKTLTSKAPGLIAARDRAEQLVDKIAPQEEGRTVVHLLEGDAFAFTTAYLYARHGIPASATTDSACTQNTSMYPVPGSCAVSNSRGASAEPARSGNISGSGKSTPEHATHTASADVS